MQITREWLDLISDDQGLTHGQQKLLRDAAARQGLQGLAMINEQYIMQNTPPKVETCANRFELISRWGQPVDKVWARDMLERWLDQRLDAPVASDYDRAIPAKGPEHA
jgi:hypothetical protein